MRIDKDYDVPEPRTSNKQHREAGGQDQPADQLLPGNDIRVWTADAGKDKKIPKKCCDGKKNVD